MEQRKRESLIPKGTFDVGPALDPAERGDASGTFARMVEQAPPKRLEPPTPIARIGLVRVAPPPPPSTVRPTSMLPPPPPPTRVAEPTLRALVAPTYPPPAPTLLVDDSERVEFPDFGLRLDVPRIAPAPVSLLPLPNERRPRANRRVVRSAVLVASLVAVGVAGWLSRGLVAEPVSRVSAPAAETSASTDVAQAPVAVAAVEEVPAAVVEEPVVAEAVAAAVVEEPATAEEVTASVVEDTAVAPQAVAVRREVSPVSAVEASAAVRAPRSDSVPSVAEPPVAVSSVEAEVAAIEEAAAPAVLEEVLAEELPETLERAEVIEGIEVLRNEYQACVGDMHGTAQMRIRIANTGRITHALAEGDYAGTPQGSCLARTLRQARFRPFVRASIEIVYPLAL